MHYRINKTPLSGSAAAAGAGDLLHNIHRGEADELALSPVNVWRRRPALARSAARISETNDTKTDCIIAQLSAFTAARRDGSLLIP